MNVSEIFVMRRKRIENIDYSLQIMCREDDGLYINREGW